MLHGPKATQVRAERLRRAMTLPDVLLWRPERDVKRDEWLRKEGVRECRIPAREVVGDLDAVARYIIVCAREGLPLHHAAQGPPPPSGGGMQGRY